MTLELDGVTKVVGGRTHIHPTNLTLERGTMNVLLGPTLSGKTSLMRLMAGLDVPTSGRLRWHGADVTGMRVQDRKVAMVYQQFINYPAMTVYDNIASPLRLMGKSAAEIDRGGEADRRDAEADAAARTASRWSCRAASSSAARWPARWSRRRGWCCWTSRWPTSTTSCARNCGPRSRKIFEASGAIFVYATTEPEEALLLGGNTATLWEGRVTQFGPTPQVYRRPSMRRPRGCSPTRR